jgi:lipopolysaccharide export system permease protein
MQSRKKKLRMIIVSRLIMKLQKLWKNRKDNITTLTSIASPVISQTNNYVQYIDKTKAKNKIKEPYKIDTLKKDKKLEVLWGAYNKIEALKTSIDSNENSIRDTVKQHNKIVIYQQRIVSYSFTCYSLIGASLGSIIRKGGMGLPVIIAIVIFIIFTF